MGVVVGDVGAHERARAGALPGLDGVDDRVVLPAKARDGDVPVGDAGCRLDDVGLDRGAEPRHRCGDDDVPGCLGERSVHLLVEGEELLAGEPGSIHRAQERADVIEGAVGIGRDLLDDGRLEEEARRDDVIDGKRLAATCSRSTADIAPRGAATMIAPALGPLPVAVRMSPRTSRTRRASRTLDRPTPSVEASSRSGGRRSPGPMRPSMRSASIDSSTCRHARAGLRSMSSATAITPLRGGYVRACVV